MTPLKKNFITVGMLFIILLSSACGAGPKPEPSPLNPILTVDPVFRAFYNYLGGENRLGRALSLPRPEGATTVQYVSAGKMVYDPAAPATGRFSMAPLGLQMELSEPPTAPPANPNIPYFGGHVIFPDFVPLVTELGLETTGLPLTEVKHNLIRKRWEQYFANLGIYRLEGSAEVRLLAYGEWVCGENCRDQKEGVLNAAPEFPEDDIDIWGKKTVDPMFFDFVNQYGTDFTGFVLDPAGISADGKWEQIFENVVLVTETRLGPGDVHLRPLSDILNIPADPPKPFGGDPNMFFLPTHGTDLGYEIPVYFWEYIEDHGGLSMFGQPLTHLALLTGAVYHQCFQNLCLAYDPGAGENSRIRPEPLGYAYKYLFGSPSATGVAPAALPTLTLAPTRAPVEITVEATPVSPAEPAPTNTPLTFLPEPTSAQPPLTFRATPTVPAAPTPTAAIPTAPPVAAVREITIQVLERSKAIGAQTAPEFGAFLWENGQPVSGAALDVTAVMPDGATRIFFMPLTDANGYTTLLLPVIEGPPSTVVPYKVCYTALADMRVCVYDYFVIWTTP